MSVSVTKFEAKPALNFNQVHMLSLTINLPEQQEFRPSMKLVYKMLAVDENGVKHFDTNVKVIDIDDYVAVATQEAMKGDTRLVDAMNSIEMALAAVLSSQADHGDATAVIS